MKIFNISDIKKFMNLFLKGELFKGFEARGIILQTFTRFEINCLLDKAFSEDTAAEPQAALYCLWQDIQPTIYELIKGKTPPRYFKISLCLSGDKAVEIAENASSLHLTFTYEGGSIAVLTGCSQKTFSMDKLVDTAWDIYTENMFKAAGVELSEKQE